MAEKELIMNRLNPIIGKRRIHCYWGYDWYWIFIEDLPNKIKAIIRRLYQESGESIKYFPFNKLLDIALAKLCEQLIVSKNFGNKDYLINIISSHYIRLEKGEGEIDNKNIDDDIVNNEKKNEENNKITNEEDINSLNISKKNIYPLHQQNNMIILLILILEKIMMKWVKLLKKNLLTMKRRTKKLLEVLKKMMKVSKKMIGKWMMKWKRSSKKW